MLAGMRPSEIYDLEKKPDVWSQYIKLDEGVLNVDGFGKQNDQRTIDLAPVAVEWLRLIHDEGWPICYHRNAKNESIRYANFRALTLLPEGEGGRYVAIRRKKRAGKEISDEDRKFSDSQRPHLEGESVDILRHTYGTNLLYQSKGKVDYVTSQMGNSDKIYYKHYKGKLDHPLDHEKFFKLGLSVVLG
jgi:integrase